MVHVPSNEKSQWALAEEGRIIQYQIIHISSEDGSVPLAQRTDLMVTCTKGCHQGFYDHLLLLDCYVMLNVTSIFIFLHHSVSHLQYSSSYSCWSSSHGIK